MIFGKKRFFEISFSRKIIRQICLAAECFVKGKDATKSISHRDTLNEIDMDSTIDSINWKARDSHSFHEVYDRKLLTKKLKYSFLVVAVTYSISVFVSGGKWGSIIGEASTKESVLLSFVFCLAVIFATCPQFFHRNRRHSYD